MKTYLITYYVYFSNGNKSSEMKIKVKRCYNELEAKMKLEKRCKDTLCNFGYLICTSCTEWNPIQDLFNSFKF